jgi:hypothetical protein
MLKEGYALWTFCKREALLCRGLTGSRNNSLQVMTVAVLQHRLTNIQPCSFHSTAPHVSSTLSRNIARQILLPHARTLALGWWPPSTCTMLTCLTSTLQGPNRTKVPPLLSVVQFPTAHTGGKHPAFNSRISRTKWYNLLQKAQDPKPAAK